MIKASRPLPNRAASFSTPHHLREDAKDVDEGEKVLQGRWISGTLSGEGVV
jgi:hypothetical protein